MPEKKFLVFLSHASEDKPTVRKLHNQLLADGFDSWLDEERILPGQDWDLEIEKAMRKSDLILLCFSEISVAKEGYIHKEYKRAMQLQQEKPEGKIFVIPVRFDEFTMPEFIKKLHWVDFPENYSRLVLALQNHQESLSTRPIQKTQIGRAKNKQIIAHKAIPWNLFLDAVKKIEEKPLEGYDIGEVVEIKEIVSKNGTKAIARFHKNGAMICKVDQKETGNAFITYGDIYDRYLKIGVEPWKTIGLPTSNEETPVPSRYFNNKGLCNTGKYSEFENGEIVWYSSGEYRGQAFVVMDPIRRVYDAIGGSDSYLGFPVSDTYTLKGMERCDFEGGSIVSLNKGMDIEIVRKLLVVNYIDSPLNHMWEQYSGPELEDSIGVRSENQISFGKNMIALSYSILSGIGIFFPKVAIDGLTLRFCGITFKSLVPNESIRVYIHTKTNSTRASILEYNSNDKERGVGYTGEEGVDYWKIPMPKKCNNSELHTILVDLESSILRGFRKKYEQIERISLRGRIGIAEILISNSREAIEAVAINPIIVE